MYNQLKIGVLSSIFGCQYLHPKNYARSFRLNEGENKNEMINGGEKNEMINGEGMFLILL